MCEAIGKEQAKTAWKAQEWGSLDKSRELTETLRAHRVRGLMKEHHAMMRVSAEHRDPKAPSFIQLQDVSSVAHTLLTALLSQQKTPGSLSGKKNQLLQRTIFTY